MGRKDSYSSRNAANNSRLNPQNDKYSGRGENFLITSVDEDCQA